MIVNGKVAATHNLLADGNVQDLSFDLAFEHSSWVAIRILPSVHTNPIFIEVAGKPIHASKQSAEWCVKAVDTCWNAKSKAIRETEREAAKAAYDKGKPFESQRLPDEEAKKFLYGQTAESVASLAKR